MAEDRIPVKFEPHNIKVNVPPGMTVREAAARGGITLDAPCGGQGTCGKCKVKFAEKAPPVTAADHAALTPEEVDKGYRLACQCAVIEPVTIEVPSTSVLDADYQILTSASFTEAIAGEPPVIKQYVELPEPTLEEDAPDNERIARVTGAWAQDLSLIRDLPRRLRDTAFAGTAVKAGERLLDFEPGNTEDVGYGVVFDIGTTTVVGSLVELASGRECAVTSRMNPQTAYGDDVLTRILHARERSDGLRDLQSDIVAAVNDMVRELCAYQHIESKAIYTATFSGNTTMQHLFAGVDPGPLGEVPFVPAMGRGLTARASDLQLHIHPLADGYIFPVIGGFVGGDTVAGILATGLADTAAPTMLVDIGTNGEIVLIHHGRLEAASTAAGPAFEGARIKCGMRAAAGAIERVDIGDGVAYSVIGGASSPVGICGSALIDIAAGLLRTGVVLPQGAMLGPGDLAGSVPGAVRERVVQRDDGPVFELVPPEKSRSGEPVGFTNRDIRELQLATAAIRAGIAILLQRAGLQAEDLDRLIVAGGFGNYLVPANAQRIGLLPGGVKPERMLFAGNTSLAGARMATMSVQARQKADEIAARVKHVDLSQDPDFQNHYVEAMMFPME